MAVLEGAVVYSNLLVLLSIGLTITYITTGIPNFAQGSMAVFGSYLSLTLWRVLGVILITPCPFPSFSEARLEWGSTH